MQYIIKEQFIIHIIKGTNKKKPTIISTKTLFQLLTIIQMKNKKGFDNLSHFRTQSYAQKSLEKQKKNKFHKLKENNRQYNKLFKLAYKYQVWNLVIIQ